MWFNAVCSVSDPWKGQVRTFTRTNLVVFEAPSTAPMRAVRDGEAHDSGMRLESRAVPSREESRNVCPGLCDDV